MRITCVLQARVVVAHGEIGRVGPAGNERCAGTITSGAARAAGAHGYRLGMIGLGTEVPAELLALDNVLFTPHIAGRSPASPRRSPSDGDR